MAQIAFMVRIAADLPEVYEKVSTAKGIASWFTEASFKVNQQFGSVRLCLWDDVYFVVTESTSPTKISWYCGTAGHPWYATDIGFEFRTVENQTAVVFDHSGWPEVSEHFRDCALSWAYFLESLKSLVETGQGTPEGVAPHC